jgi:hypothetical protein
MISANRRGRGANTVATVEKKQGTDSSPAPRRLRFAATLHLEQFSAVLCCELQTREPRWDLHPLL